MITWRQGNRLKAICKLGILSENQDRYFIFRLNTCYFDALKQVFNGGTGDR
jgi:hypothetical protein